MTVTTADVHTEVDSHTRQPPRSRVTVLFTKSSVATKKDSGYLNKMGASWNDVKARNSRKRNGTGTIKPGNQGSAKQSR